MICEELLKERELPVLWDKNETDWNTRREQIKDVLQREEFRPEK